MSTPSAPSRRSYKGTVIIEVGKDTTKKDHFIVSTCLVKDHSDFFRAALTGDWKERDDGKVRLPEDDVDPFQIFINWLHYKVIDLTQIMSVADADKPFKRIEALLPCWTLGDFLGATDFQNSVMNDLTTDYRNMRDLPSPAEVYFVYENTVKSAHLRSLLIDRFAQSAPEQMSTEAFVTTYPSEFVQACDERLEHLASALPIETTLCESVCLAYHVHGAGEQVPCIAPCAHGTEGRCIPMQVKF